MKIKEELFHYFKDAGTTVHYPPQTLIYMQEDDSKNLYLVMKGRVRVYTLNDKGEEITFEVLEKGRIFGESSFFQQKLRPTSVEAITEVELISVYLEDLYPYLSESNELTMALMSLLSQTNDYLVSLIKKAYSYNRYEKVASFLLEQTVSENQDKGIINDTLPYTHEQIATVVGLSRVTVTKVLDHFKKEGLIENKYGHIVIINKKGLRNILEH